MPSKKILFLIFCTLLSQNSFSRDFILKKAVTLNLENSQIDINDDNSIIKLLENEGVFLDDQSSITIHEEKNNIDLTCFNCLIRNIPEQLEHYSSYNERT